MDKTSNILFKNVFKPNRRQLWKAYRRMYFGITKKQQWLLFTIIAAVFAMVLIPPLTRGTEFTEANAVLFWTAVTMLWMLCMVCYILPFLFAVIALRKMKKAGADITLENAFDESRVSIRNSGAEGETILRYNVFIGLEEVDDLLLLKTGSRQAIILPKEGFVVGNAAGFIRFISRKLRE